jgi:hypothetical protein
MEDLHLERLTVFYPGDLRYELAHRMTVVPLAEIVNGRVDVRTTVPTKKRPGGRRWAVIMTKKGIQRPFLGFFTLHLLFLGFEVPWRQIDRKPREACCGRKQDTTEAKSMSKKKYSP